MASIQAGTLGTEEVVDEVYLALRENFNSKIDDMSVIWDDYDKARATRMGIEWDQILVEPVPADNFHLGEIPSFVQNDDREGNYPMIVVIPGRTVPDAENAVMDHFNVYQNGLEIHSFGRADPTEGSEVAYRRAMRMAEATHQVIHDPSFRYVVAGVTGPTLVERSEPWYFPSEDGYGEDWCWRAVMHQYQVKNYSR